MKIKIFLVSALVFSIAGCGNPSENNETVAVVAGHGIPACYNSKHQKVRVGTTDSKEGGPAFSTQSQSGIPEIFFNTILMGAIAHSKTMVMFVYEHECGHHALGHLEDGQKTHHDVSKKEHFKEELDADCYAAQRLKQMGYSASSITDVIDDVYPWPKDPEHPSGKTRSSHIAACFKAYGKKHLGAFL